MTLVKSNRKSFIDIQGIPRIIRECPVNSFGDLKEYYSIYWELVLESDPGLEKNFHQLIEEEECILSVSLAIMRLLGCQDEWFGVDTLGALIHSYEGPDGSPHKGYIWEHYFEKRIRPETNKESISLDEYRYRLMASMAELEGGIHNVIPLLDMFSLEDAEGYFAARNQMDREANREDPVVKRERLKELYKKRFKGE